MKLTHSCIPCIEGIMEAKGEEYWFICPRCAIGTDLEYETVEALWVEVHLKKNTLFLCNIYHPPKSDLTVFDQFSDMLERASSEGKEDVVIGDMNCNLLVRNSLSERLLLITDENNMSQLISQPTRIISHSQTLIDVLFCSNPTNFSTSGTVAFTGSDRLIYGERAERPKVPSTVKSSKKCN